MHEASLMRNLMTKILGVAELEGASRVTRVRVRLGALSHMSESHFLEHFVIAARGTKAEGAKVEAVCLTDPKDPMAQQIVLESVDVSS